MVSKTPPTMSAEDRVKFENMQSEVEEDQPSSNGHIAGEVSDLRPAGDGFRYDEQRIFGIDKKVRMRSLTAKQFDEVKLQDDKNLLLYAIVRANDQKPYLSPEELEDLMGVWDARTYIELLQMANKHCLPTLTLDALVEGAAKN